MLKPAILLDFPEQLETERLILRPPRPDEGPVANAAVQESLDALSRWMPWAANGQSVEDSTVFVREAAAAFITRERLNYFMWRKQDRLFLGSLGAFRLAWSIPSCEIGYWLRTSLEGQGYVTEAVNRLTQFLFDELGMNRIEIRCESENQRSAAVAERCGFKLEARLRNHRWGNSGQLITTLIYAKLREEG
jgi:RimJ/RimL family protein N-acetyltransferase